MIADEMIPDDVRYGMEIEEAEIPDEFPTFGVGQLYDLQGYPFEVVRLNASSLVLRPIPPDGYSARDVMRAIKITASPVAGR